MQIVLPGVKVLPDFIINETDDENPLPTPPASPPPRPRPRQTVSFILPHDEIELERPPSGKKPEPLAPPTPNMSQSPDSDSNSSHSSSSTSSALGIVGNMQTALVDRVHAFMTRGVIRSHIFAAFSMMTWFIGIIVHRAFSIGLGFSSPFAFFPALRRRAAGIGNGGEINTGKNGSGAAAARRSGSGGVVPSPSIQSPASPSTEPAPRDVHGCHKSSEDTSAPSPVSPAPVEGERDEARTPAHPALKSRSLDADADAAKNLTDAESKTNTKTDIVSGCLRWQLPRAPPGLGVVSNSTGSGTGKLPLLLVLRSSTRQPSASDITVEVDGQAALVSSVGEVGERVTLLELERAASGGEPQPGSTSSFECLVVKLRE